MRWRGVAGLIWMALPAAASAAEPAVVEAPAYRVGDSWTVDQTTQTGTSGFSRERLVNTIDRVSSDELLVGVKQDGSPRAPEERRIGSDLSLKLLVDGNEVIAARPLAFPLKVGDSWTADWVDPRHLGNQTSAHFHRNYKVVDWEDVTVPAGTFHALKIEAKGSGDAQIFLPAHSSTAGVAGQGAATVVAHAQTARNGVLHRSTFDTIYYAPEVRYFVKLVEEQYNASDVLTKRDTTELVSFQPAK